MMAVGACVQIKVCTLLLALATFLAFLQAVTPPSYLPGTERSIPVGPLARGSQLHLMMFPVRNGLDCTIQGGSPPQLQGPKKRLPQILGGRVEPCTSLRFLDAWRPEVE